jgi:hypothetical protein
MIPEAKIVSFNSDEMAGELIATDITKYLVIPPC